MYSTLHLKRFGMKTLTKSNIMGHVGLDIWLTIQCHGGAARITLPDYIANYTFIQADNSGIWTLVPIPNNATISVTGLGIRFEANESIANAALNTLTYGKGQDNVCPPYPPTFYNLIIEQSSLTHTILITLLIF
jgi:hypothetical protein